MRHLILETPEADLFLEEDVDKNLYLHLDYKADKWTKTIYLNMLQTLTEILEGLEKKGVKTLYALLFKEDIKMIRFTTAFGFVPEAENKDYLRLKLKVVDG